MSKKITVICDDDVDVISITTRSKKIEGDSWVIGIFDVADNNSVTVAQQAVYSSYGSYGTLYVSGNGALQSNKITVNLTFRVSAGVFGAFTETFILPVTEP